jgi:hypothetical protein
MSTWQSLIINLFVINARMICILSHCIRVFWLIRKCMTSKSRFHHMSSLSAVDMISNSTLMKLVIIVRCLNAFQSIISLNSLNAYSWELYLIRISSAKNASLLIKKMLFALSSCRIWSALNSMINFLVWLRYFRVRFVDFMWNLDELIKNSDNLEATCATFDLMMTAVKFMNSTLYW